MQWKDDQTGVFDNFYKADLNFFQIQAHKIMNQLDTKGLVNVEQVVQALCLELKQRLMSYCSGVLLTNFQKWKMTEVSNNENYAIYNESLLNEQVRTKLLTAYPVMNKLIARTIRQQLEQLYEIISRFLHDREALQVQFKVSLQCLEKVEHLNSDPHKDGRNVVLLTFTNNKKIVYKPRSLAGETTFNRFLEYLNTAGALRYALKNTKILDRAAYGWQEFVMQKPCNTVSEIKRYFYRVGAYSALFQLLQTSDLHYENIIAAGEYPLFIDLETLVSVKAKKKAQETVLDLFYNEVNGSIIGSLLFPQQLIGSQKTADLSGLTGGSLKIEKVKIIAKGTTDICEKTQVTQLNCVSNQVTLGKERIDPNEYFTDILAGVSDCFKILYEQKDFFVNEIAAGKLVSGTYRQVLRPTHVYAKYLDSVYRPEYLENTQKTKQLLNIITETAAHKKRTQIELSEMLNNDIPHFVCASNSTTLQASNQQTVENYFETTPQQLVENKFKQLTKQEITKQKYYLRLAFNLYAQNKQLANEADLLADFAPDGDFNDKLLDLFETTAIWDCKKEKCTWLLIDNDGETYALSPLIPSFYLNAGIIWYLAIAGEQRQQMAYTKMAKGAIKGITELPKSFMGETPSAFAGYYSLIYLYYNLSVLWKDKTLLHQSYQLIKSISVDQNTSLEQIDYVNGISGMIHLLTRIYEKDKQDFILETACMLGEKLDASLKSAEAKTGLAHGLSGYALALASLWQHTNNKTYKERTLKLLEAEDQLFDSISGNWIDVRTSQSKLNYWCYGAWGILLARKQITIYLNDQTISQSSICIRALKNAWEMKETSLNNSLCHGNAGNGIIRQLLADIAAENGLTTMQNVLNFTEKPYQQLPTLQFMLGLTGVGYALLRQEEPSLPAMLDLSLLSS
ncbi:Lantibiotic modifying enzyme [Listeria grayi]|uniref:type 2 lanthipeptide synthetase LanM family protein n=2 Tax=Listeria grayi TaxID=1641 RepID=UPI000F6E3F42|nr:type 2 lanthipeptide synthetase LanM family protein [Listeria grayi]VEI31252.1 Lantibiotic modifying enzyme [Listeria grayi]